MTLGFLHVSLQIIAQSVLPASGNMPKLHPVKFLPLSAEPLATSVPSFV